MKHSLCYLYSVLRWGICYCKTWHANYDYLITIHVMRYISDNLKHFQPRNWFSTWRSFQFLSISGLILFRTGENIYCRSQIAGVDILFWWIWRHSKFCFFLHFSKLLTLWEKTAQHPTLKLVNIKTSQSWQSCWICSNPRWVNIPMSQYPKIRISGYPNIPTWSQLHFSNHGSKWSLTILCRTC